jgi:VWFA-related protein
MAPAFRAAALLILCGLCGLLRAQTPPKEVSIRTHPYTPPSAVLHAESNLVETGLTVRDSRGHAVAGLHASDFEVLDNGAPRQIAAFSELRPEASSPAAAASAAMPLGTVPSAAAAPLPPKFVTFFFDDFHVANGSMQFVKQGARAFIAKGVKPGDHLAIATASGQGDLDFTTDAKAFAERLERLSSHVRPVVTHYCGVSPIDSYIFLHHLDGQIVEAAIAAAMKCANCGGDSAAQCRSTAYGIAQEAASTTWEQIEALSHDTIDALNFAVKRLSQMNGTRILVLTSSGFLVRPGVPPELQNFIDKALRWNIVVDAIGAQGLEAGVEGPKAFLRRSLFSMPLENIANGTGGHYFKDTNDLAGAMELAADPEVSYVLAFNAGSPDGKFHTLKIRFQSKRGGDLQFRPGYFSPDPKKEVSARARLDDAVFSKQTLREIPVSVVIEAGQPKDGGVPVSIRLRVDVKALQFTAFNGRHMQQIVFVTALLDPNGGFVTGEESIMDLALTDEKLASFQETGLTAIANLHAHTGIFQIRTIVREGMKGNLAADSAPIEVRAK